MAEQNYDYIAFISYAHLDNEERGRKWANWLRKVIEGYPIPRNLVGKEFAEGTIPRRMKEVFLDDSDLPPGGELGAKLEKGLSRSRFLVVVCSPQSAGSKYVGLEIASFTKTHDVRSIIPVVIDGDFSPNSALCSFHENLLDLIPERGRLEEHLPLSVDFRVKEDQPDGGSFAPGWTHPRWYRKALRNVSGPERRPWRTKVAKYEERHKIGVNKLMSALLGVRPRELRTLAEHEDRIRQRWKLTIVTCLAAVMAGLAGIASYFYVVAERERLKQDRSLQMIGDAHEGATRLVADVLVDLRAKLEPAGQQVALENARRIVDEYFNENELQGDDDDSLHMRSVVLNSRGYLARRTGDFERAEKCYDEALGIREQLLARDSDKAMFQHNLAISYDNLGDLHVAKARHLSVRETQEAEYGEALSDYRESLQWVRELASRPKAPPRWRHDLAVSQFKIGTAWLEMGDKEEALKELLIGYPVAEEVAASDRNYAKWQAHFGLYCLEIGKIHGLSGRYDEAIEILKRGRDVFYELRRKGPLPRQYLDWLNRIEEFLLDLE